MPRLCLSTFTVAERHGGWAVTRDGVLYGDYEARVMAVEGAKTGARAMQDRGGMACVFLQPGNQVIPH